MQLDSVRLQIDGDLITQRSMCALCSSDMNAPDLATGVSRVPTMNLGAKECAGRDDHVPDRFPGGTKMAKPEWKLC